MKVVGEFFNLCKYFLITYNNMNTESQKQFVEKDDETAVANEVEQELIEDHPVQNSCNFNSDHEDQNYYNDEQLFGADCTIDNVK